MENANHILDITNFWQFIRWNLFGNFRFLLFSWMFKSQITSSDLRKTIIGIMILALSVFVIEYAFLGTSALYSISRYIQDILVIIVIVIYAIDVFREAIVYKLDKNILSWISVTYLTIYISFPVIQMAKLHYYRQEPLFTNLLWILTAILVVMYAILSFGFVWSEKKY